MITLEELRRMVEATVRGSLDRLRVDRDEDWGPDVIAMPTRCLEFTISANEGSEKIERRFRVLVSDVTDVPVIRIPGAQ